MTLTGPNFGKTILNYIGQLRLYSYADLLLLFFWLDLSTKEIISCSLLWFGFLIYLETVHKDTGRSQWNIFAWIIPWLLALLIIQKWQIIFFFMAAILYTLKKKKNLGFISSVFNGLVKVGLIIFLPVANTYNILIIFTVMTFRNLMGDFRDIEKDNSEKMRTLPIILGFKNDIKFLYPSTLALSSALWFILGDVSIIFLVITWLVQLITYSWTPR